MSNIDIITSEMNIQTVTVTTGRNGYPMGIYRAAVLGTQNETEEFAKEIGGEVVLLRRKSGWQLWENRGRLNTPYEFSIEDRAFNEDEEANAYEVRTADDYRRAIDAANRDLAEASDEELDDCELYEPDKDIVQAIEDADSKALFIVTIYDYQQSIDYVFRDGATSWHDSDCWEYQIAVVCND